VEHAARIDALSERFRSRFGRAPDGVAEAPGRVNLIGEHIDYNDGLVLPLAIDRSVLVAYAPRDDATVRAYGVDFDEESAFALALPIARDDARPWSTFVRGIAAVLLKEGFGGVGLDLAITGDVPQGAGLSSSAALEVALLGAFRAVWGLDVDDKRLALLAQRAENEYVGVQCGVMDQLAAVFGQKRHALLIDCRTLDVKPVPLRLEEQDVAIVVIDSGVRRALAQSAYNRRREECAEALRLLREAMPREVASWRDVTLDDVLGQEALLPDVLVRRARHVVSETERVRASAQALRADDFERLGALMDASHVSLRDDFEVSSPELDRLVELARGASGVLGARLTGAGFGGCTVQLARREGLDALRAAVLQPYREATDNVATLYVCHASDGLRVHGLARG
jgi:galactokinase